MGVHPQKISRYILVDIIVYSIYIYIKLYILDGCRMCFDASPYEFDSCHVAFGNYVYLRKFLIQTSFHEPCAHDLYPVKSLSAIFTQILEEWGEKKKEHRAFWPAMTLMASAQWEGCSSHSVPPSCKTKTIGPKKGGIVSSSEKSTGKQQELNVKLGI